MGGFFGAVSRKNCKHAVFFGTDYHSHLGTKRGGIAMWDEQLGFQRQIHSIETSPFRTKFEDDLKDFHGNSGIGCISVISNLLPAETVDICNKWFAGDTAGAAALQCKYKRLVDALFSEVNPIPIKAAMAAMGLCGGYARLPLTPMEEPARQHLLACMREVGLDV